MQTVDYFIDKFRVIPEDKWIINSYGAFGPNRCALGHATFPRELSWIKGALKEAYEFGRRDAKEKLDSDE